VNAVCIKQFWVAADKGAFAVYGLAQAVKDSAEDKIAQVDEAMRPTSGDKIARRYTARVFYWEQNKIIVIEADNLGGYSPSVAEVYTAKLAETERRPGRFDRKPGDSHNRTLAIQEVDLLQCRVQIIKINNAIIQDTPRYLINLSRQGPGRYVPIVRQADF
jgi:hypothetical protein